VALARALVFDPRVLLMDEPLGALDKQLRERLQLEIKALHGKLGVTIVYVTHDQQEALVMSDRIAVMNRGRIEQVGTPTELYDEPVSRFVASFIGETNFLAGRVSADGPVAAIEIPGVGVLRGRGNGNLPGAPAELAVRPEKIVFADEIGDGPANVVEGTIGSAVFVGDAWRYEATLAGGQTLVLRRQHRAGVAHRQPGAPVRLAWSVDDGRLVAADGES
jgi:putative spermidine/putrescine transport system ATP-binding protein